MVGRAGFHHIRAKDPDELDQKINDFLKNCLIRSVISIKIDSFILQNRLSGQAEVELVAYITYTYDQAMNDHLEKNPLVL